MLNRTYNNIIRLIGFLFTLGFVVAKIMNLITQSWWYILIPIILTFIFSKETEEHIYIVKNASEIDEIENINEDDVEPDDSTDSDSIV